MIKADRALAPSEEPKDNVRFGLTHIQCALRRLYKRLSCPPGGSGEADQGTQGRDAAEPDRLLAVPGEPVRAAAGGGGVHAPKFRPFGMTLYCNGLSSLICPAGILPAG